MISCVTEQQIQNRDQFECPNFLMLKTVGHRNRVKNIFMEFNGISIFGRLYCGKQSRNTVSV